MFNPKMFNKEERSWKVSKKMAFIKD